MNGKNKDLILKIVELVQWSKMTDSITTTTAQQQSEEALTQRELERKRIRERIREEAKNIKIRQAEGEYEFDNPDLEYKTKRMTKLHTLEEKYKDKPKIAFHELSDEGNKSLMQAKRDQVWTTIGWSVVGNVGGIAVVNYIERNNKKWQALRVF